MKRRTMLFVLNENTPDDQIAEAAQMAAEIDNRLICLALAKAPALPGYAYGVSPYGGMNVPDNWTELVAEARQQQRTRIDEVEVLLAKHAVSSDIHSAMCATADIRHHVGRIARVSDEAFVAANLQDAPKILREVAYGVLYHSPIALHLGASPSRKTDRVFVAWDSSEAASSAVHAALPYLKEAQEVIIGCIDPVMTTERDGQDPGTDVAAWLSHHGCTVTVSQYPSGGREIADCLQDRAREVGADLVVMGAYGHARMLQAVFGGTTQTMVEQKNFPVLLAH